MALSEKDLSEGQGRSPDQTEEDTEFFDYVLILFRYRWLIFWTVSLCTAGILLYVSVQEPEFESVATIYSQRLIQQQRFISVLSSEVARRDIVRKLYQYERGGETPIVDLTEILGAGSEQRAVQTLQGMVRFLESPNQQYVTSIVVTSRSPQLSAIVANAYVVQLLQEEYDNLKERRRLLAPNDLANIRKTDFVTNEFEKLEMEMDTVGVEVFQGFQIGNVEVRSLAVPTAVPFKKYGMNVVVAAGLAIGVCVSVLLVFLIEYGRHNLRLLASLTNELRKDVEWVSGRLGKK